jgi:hypothetical protein
MSRNQRGEERMSSSVKWLSNQTYELFEQYSEGNFDRITLNRLVLEATEKAKEMHKKESIAFALHYTFGHQELSDQIKGNLEKLYDQYFGGGKQ